METLFGNSCLDKSHLSYIKQCSRIIVATLSGCIVKPFLLKHDFLHEAVLSLWQSAKEFNLDSHTGASWHACNSDRLQKGHNGKGGICICLPVHCLSVQPDRQPHCHTKCNIPSLLADDQIACLYTDGACSCYDIVPSSRSPPKCR